MQKGGHLDGCVRKLAVRVARIPKSSVFLNKSLMSLLFYEFYKFDCYATLVL